MGDDIFALAVMAHQWEAERIIASQILQLEMEALPAIAGAVPLLAVEGVYDVRFRSFGSA